MDHWLSHFAFGLWLIMLSLLVSFSNASVMLSKSHLILLSWKLVLPLSLQRAWQTEPASGVPFSGISVHVSWGSLITITRFKLHSISLFDTFLLYSAIFKMNIYFGIYFSVRHNVITLFIEYVNIGLRLRTVWWFPLSPIIHCLLV